MDYECDVRYSRSEDGRCILDDNESESMTKIVKGGLTKF